MQTTSSGDIRSIFVFGSIAAVLPLVFFPNNWGLDFFWNFWAVAGLELILYFLIWQVIFPVGQIQDSLGWAFKTALLRWGCGILFGFMTFILAGTSLGEGIQNGLSNYFPALFIQVVAAPLIIKSAWLDRQSPRRRGFVSETGSDRSEPILSHKTFPAEHAAAQLEDILGYVKDYSGVEACLLVDQEGLILAQKGDPYLEFEALAPLAELLESSCLKVLARIGEKRIEKIETYTPRLRLLVHQVQDFRLVVIADRRTDDLLNVRIQRVVEQINKRLNEKYPHQILTTREGEYVRNSGRTQ
ncbi:MAG: hypothetical protein A2142_09215 [candidate division Zixibacteria bacterium RBG_16_48_11]|nr:MAG: hypothetical protein A2142_09215 [candidate division Zixibacteria bacterium RBG_16_48_11]